jgi:hypothetical protein
MRPLRSKKTALPLFSDTKIKYILFTAFENNIMAMIYLFGCSLASIKLLFVSSFRLVKSLLMMGFYDLFFRKCKLSYTYMRARRSSETLDAHLLPRRLAIPALML